MSVDRERALRDLAYFGREAMGFDYFESPNGKVKQIEWDGEIRECGMVEYGPHLHMSEAFQSDEDVFLMATRGCLKTTWQVARIVWRITRDPDVRILLHMETLDRAKESVGLVRRTFESERFIDIFGDMRGPVWTNEKFIVAGRTIDRRDATLFASGTDKVITGNHVDELVIDDPVSWQQATSAQQMQKSIKAFQYLVPILDPGGRMIVTMTPYDEQDLSGFIQRNLKHRFRIVVLPCGMEAVEGESGADELVGKPVFPNLMEEELQRRLDIMGPALFNTQYALKLQNPADQIFYRDQFVATSWSSLPPVRHHYLLSDTATTDSDSACWSVLAMVAIDDANNLYICDLDIGHWKPGQYQQHFLTMLEKWDQRVSVRGICMESTSANKVYRDQLEDQMRVRGIRCPWYQPTRGSSDIPKRQRIRGLAQRFSNRQVFVVDDTIRKTVTDLGRIVTIWDKRGVMTKDGGYEPDGELVRQFVNFRMTSGSAEMDIPDALADVDAKGQKGGTLLPRPSADSYSVERNQARGRNQRRPGSRINFRHQRGPRGWTRQHND